jgi:hypothetical protein
MNRYSQFDLDPAEYLLQVLESIASRGLSPDVYSKYLLLKQANPPRAKATSLLQAFLAQLAPVLLEQAPLDSLLAFLRDKLDPALADPIADKIGSLCKALE